MSDKESDDEIKRLRAELHEAGDGDTWREACKRCEAEIERLQKLVLGQERCFVCNNGSIYWLDGAIGPLCEECNDKLRTEVMKDICYGSVAPIKTRTTMTEIVPAKREVIEKKLLTALDGDKVAVVMTEVDLSTVIKGLLRLGDEVPDRGMLQGLLNLRMAAFPPEPSDTTGA